MDELTIHQIWYRDEQQAFLDPAMRPWDNRKNLRPEWCEYWVMRQASADFERNFNTLTGFFSWKFRNKIGLTHARVHGFIESLPGMDCYIFSPTSFQTACYLNVWQQGESWHPGITAKATRLLARQGYQVDLEKTVDHHLTSAYSNHWVASQRFWRAYLNFMGGIFDALEAGKDSGDDYFTDCAYSGVAGGHVRALPIIPYIIERLFAVFVRLHPEFRIAAWEWPLEELKARTFPEAGLIPLANWCKLMFCETRDVKYLYMFQDAQTRLLEAMQRTFAANPQAIIQ
jgi:hypothetical protein